VVDATDGPDTGLDVNTNATDGPGFGPDINTNEVLINQLGFLKLQPDTSTPNFATALFGNLPNTITAGQVQAVFDLTTDTCRVTPVEAINFEAPKLDIFGLQPDLTSAGETVMLSSNAGTFATLNSSDGPTGPLYNTDVALNVATPSGLTADITGAEFPSFMNVRIEDVPALQVTSPAAGQNVDAFSFFQWRANIEPLSVVEIYSTGIDANGQEVTISTTSRLLTYGLSTIQLLAEMLC